MVPFICPEIFPHSVLPLVANHFRNPTASSDTDARLAYALKQFDERKPDIHFIHEVPSGSLFRIKNLFLTLKIERFQMSHYFRVSSKTTALIW
jgi:hypothetical protein